jgi:hypothetical protein
VAAWRAWKKIKDDLEKDIEERKKQRMNDPLKYMSTTQYLHHMGNEIEADSRKRFPRNESLDRGTCFVWLGIVLITTGIMFYLLVWFLNLYF